MIPTDTAVYQAETRREAEHALRERDTLVVEPILDVDGLRHTAASVRALVEALRAIERRGGAEWTGRECAEIAGAALDRAMVEAQP